MPTEKPIQRGSWGLEVDQPLYMPPGKPAMFFVLRSIWLVKLTLLQVTLMRNTAISSHQISHLNAYICALIGKLCAACHCQAPLYSISKLSSHQ